MLSILAAARSLEGSRQLTTDEVFDLIPSRWIPTLEGEQSLRAILRREYRLPAEAPEVHELHHFLTDLRDHGRIYYESQTIDGFHHMHCRRVDELSSDI